MKTQVAIGAGVVAAIFSTACCFGPLLLVTLGFSGAAAAKMEYLAPFQTYFAAATLILMGLAFHHLYIRPRRCAPGDVCESPAVLRRQRVAFWLVVALITAMALFPPFSEYLY